MAGGAGRPMAALIPGGEERSFLERQARRRQVSRSLSERSRMVLSCAEELPDKETAAESGVHGHMSANGAAASRRIASTDCRTGSDRDARGP